ncbi:hypothetical protein GN956_G24377 [Arapaima gigas]
MAAAPAFLLEAYEPNTSGSEVHELLFSPLGCDCCLRQARTPEQSFLWLLEAGGGGSNSGTVVGDGGGWTAEVVCSTGFHPDSILHKQVQLESWDFAAAMHSGTCDFCVINKPSELRAKDILKQTVFVGNFKYI